MGISTTKKPGSSSSSFFYQLFPPNRNRAKELEAAERFVPKVPPYIGSVALGYEPSWITSSPILCPAVSEYALANYLVPYFYNWGIDTPNKVTLLNLFVVRIGCLFFLIWSGGEEKGLVGYWILAILLYLQMVFDALDGQMACYYGLKSDFGAWLDTTTDNIFGLCFTIAALHKTATTNGNWMPTIIASMIFLLLCVCGNCYVASMKQNLRWNEQNMLQKLGNYQIMFASYIYAALVFMYVYLGWWH